MLLLKWLTIISVANYFVHFSSFMSCMLSLSFWVDWIHSVNYICCKTQNLLSNYQWNFPGKVKRRWCRVVPHTGEERSVFSWDVVCKLAILSDLAWAVLDLGGSSEAGSELMVARACHCHMTHPSLDTEGVQACNILVQIVWFFRFHHI